MRAKFSTKRGIDLLPTAKLPYMCQGEEYLVTLENFKVDRPLWVEFRLFKDVSSDGFVAASGIYRFDKKAPNVLSDTQRRDQSELFKSEKISI